MLVADGMRRLTVAILRQRAGLVWGGKGQNRNGRLLRRFIAVVTTPPDANALAIAVIGALCRISLNRGSLAHKAAIERVPACGFGGFKDFNDVKAKHVKAARRSVGNVPVKIWNCEVFG